MLGHRALNVEDYLVILRRRWWIIVIPTIIVPIISYSMTYLIPPQYVSQTLVLIEQQQVPTDFVRPVISEDLDSRLASMREQILSRSSMEPIIQEFNLYGNGMSMDDRIDLARNSITIRPIRSDIARSNGLPGFFISFRAGDPHTAQMVCERVTGLFVKQNLLSRTAAVEDTTNFLVSQLNAAKATLDDEDAKLAAFQRQYFGKLPGDEGSNINILSTLGAQLEAENESISSMESQKSIDEALVAQQSQSASTLGGATTQTPQAEQVQLDKLLAEEDDLKAHYQPDYPDLKTVRRKIEDLRKEMAQAASAPAPVVPVTSAPNRADSTNVQQLRAQIRGLDQSIQAKRKEQEQIEQQVNVYQARVQSTPQVEEEYKELTRDNQMAQSNYDSLLAKITQSKMANALEQQQQGEQFKIMDPANLPDAPVYPRRGVFITGGLVGGVGLGLLIVALLEYKDTALRSERDVWAFTQLPTLAVIAWSEDVAQVKAGRLVRLKRLFSRKPPKDVLADAPG